MTSTENTLSALGARAAKAQKSLARAGSAVKDRALLKAAELLRSGVPAITAANALDIAAAREAGVREAMIDRLALDAGRIEGIARSMEEIAALPDPAGRVLTGNTHPNGMKIEKVTAPFGVIGVIYEARPNVTCDAAALCLKSGNAAILRGGKEAIRTNTALEETLRRALEESGLPADCVILVKDTSRRSSVDMMGLTDHLDLLIPRGGAGLIKSVVENAKVPVIETGTGNCHVYVAQSADIDTAVNIIYNAKTSRPSVCNACESLLINRAIAEDALPAIKAKLDEKNVVIAGDKETLAIIDGAVPATEEDWGTEYLDYKLSCKIVGDTDEAIEHINRYGTKHSECIVTKDYAEAEKFLNEVDAAAVYVNASTRFTDGGVFGFGAEIGISTQKLHARGPVGLPELVTTKYVIRGDGQVRR